MTVNINDPIFSASVLGASKIDAAIVVVMNSSSTFQNLFAIVSANGIPIRIGDPSKESGTFFLPVKTPSSPNGEIVIDPTDFTYPAYIADPRILVARIAHELAHAADWVKASSVVGADGLAPTAIDSSNIGPADYSSKRGKDEGLGLTQEFFVAKDLGLGVFSGGETLFKQMDAAYGKLANAGLSIAEVTTALTFVAGTVGRNLVPSTNGGLNDGLSYGQVDIKTFIVRQLGFTDASGNAIDSKSYPTSNIVEYAHNDDGSYRISGIDPRTGELVTKQYESESDGRSKLFSTTRATIFDDGSRRERIRYEDGRPDLERVVDDGGISVTPPKNWFQRLFSEYIDTDGDGFADKIVSAAPTENGVDFNIRPVVGAGGEVTVSVSGELTSSNWSVGLTQIFDDGSSSLFVNFSNGTSQTLTTNSDGSLFSREVTVPKGIGSETIRYNGAGALQSITTRQGDDDGNTLVSVTTGAGTTTSAYDPGNNLISETFTPAGAAANFDTAAQTAVDLIRFGQLLNSNAPGLIKLASGAVLLNDLTARSSPDGAGLFSTGTGQVLGGIVSLYNLSNAWQYGDGLAKTTATLSSLNFVNQTFIGNQALGTALNGSGLAGGAPGILPALGLISAIKANDPIGMTQSAIALFNPALLYSAGAVTPLGWVLIGASILQSFFNDDSPPDAWGVANVSFGPGITNYLSQINATGENFGPERVRGQLQSTLDALNGLIAQTNSGNPDSSQHLGIIPQRLPSLNYRAAEFADKGYSVTDIDPLTGAQRAHFLRFECSGALQTDGKGWMATSCTETRWRSANEAFWRDAA